MAWLAVNKDKTELITPEKPVRGWGNQCITQRKYTSSPNKGVYQLK